MNMPPMRPRSAVDSTDPILRAQAVKLAVASRKCGYLMVLAAWQRGLTVEFFGSQADARVNIKNMPAQSAEPALFSITDGRNRHFFCLSMGDATTPEIGDLARNKDVTKRRFMQAGVRTPRAALWTGHNLSEIVSFAAQIPGRTFVVKPSGGSLREGVQMGLPAAQVIQRLSNIGATPTLIEEQIVGLEYRAYVVDGRVVAAGAKPGISVTGNGRESIAQLIQRKNAPRLIDPVLQSCIIDLAAAVQHLAERGQTAARVPALGERVVLSESNNLADGADVYSVIDTLDPDIEQMAIAACAAIGLPNGGVDIIFDGKQAYVLELNVRAAIGSHSFPSVGPGVGNVVAEAIVDWYFPTPDGTPPLRHTAVLDSTEVAAAFKKLGVKTRFRIPPIQVPG